jgi:hypothetical protein
MKEKEGEKGTKHTWPKACCSKAPRTPSLKSTGSFALVNPTLYPKLEGFQYTFFLT